jgi:YVTN family beta-propeller protein
MSLRRSIGIGGLAVALSGCQLSNSATGSLPVITTNAATTTSPSVVTATTSTTALPGPTSTTTTAPLTVTTVAFVSSWPVPIGQLHRKLGEAKTGPNPKQVAFTPNGRELWTPLLGSTGVDVFSVPDLKKVARIPLGKHGGVEVIFTRDGKRAYVSQMQTASVYEIDTNTKRVLRILKTGGNWTKILELSPDEKTLYAANWVSDDISVLDLETGALKQKIPTVKTPRGLLVSDDGNTLYVAGFENGEIVRINMTPGTAVRSTVLYKTGGAMRHLALDRKAGLLYADDMGRDAVFIVDTATGVVRTMAKTDSHPNTIDLSPDSKYLYVSNRGQNSPRGYNQYGPDYGSVLVFDVTTGKAVDAIVGGNQTTGLDVSPDGTLLAFTDFQDARVQLYAIPSAEILAKSDSARVKSYKSELLRKRR